MGSQSARFVFPRGILAALQSPVRADATSQRPPESGPMLSRRRLLALAAGAGTVTLTVCASSSRRIDDARQTAANAIVQEWNDIHAALGDHPQLPVEVKKAYDQLMTQALSSGPTLKHDYSDQLDSYAEAVRAAGIDEPKVVHDDRIRRLKAQLTYAEVNGQPRNERSPIGQRIADAEKMRY
ncbi:hypothetical protein LJR230_004891 [Trinickia sp. LjRoot230]